jgi:hypothetical protein
MFEYGAGAAPPEALVELLTELGPSSGVPGVLVDCLRHQIGWPLAGNRFTDQEYRQAVLDIGRNQSWSAVQRNHFVAFVVETLPDGWAEAQPEPILDMLWTLTFAGGQRGVVDSMRVLKAVGSEIVDGGDLLLDIPAIDAWLELLQDDPRLERIVNLKNIRRLLAEKGRLDDIAQSVVHAVLSGASEEDVVSAFTGYRLTPDGLLAVATRITDILAGDAAYDRPPYHPGFTLVHAYLSGRLDSVDPDYAADYARRLGVAATAQLDLTVRVLSISTGRMLGRPDQPITTGPLSKLLERTNDMVEQLRAGSPDGHRGFWNQAKSSIPFLGRKNTESDVDR